MKLKKWVCSKCGHVWIPRKEAKPFTCPSCQNPRYIKEYKEVSP